MVRGDANLPSVSSLNIFEKNVKYYCEYFYTSLIEMLKEWV